MHDEKWIKDEMQRRLWLCDKWFGQLDRGKAELYDTLLKVVDDHLKVFLDYRQRYYGIDASADKEALNTYLLAKNHAAIRSKLAQYKSWWSDNKAKPITLP